jgi:hypothetical protein
VLSISNQRVAISKEMIQSRGVDGTRMVVVPVSTVQEFRTQSLKILDKYIEQPEKRQKTNNLCIR